MIQSIQLVGQANVLAKMKYWQTVKIKQEVRKALELTAKKIEASAVQMAPKDTGALKASMWSRMKTDTEAEIGDGVYYGYFVELGHGNIAPQPFLMPAVEANKKVFSDAMKKVFK